MQPDLPSRNQNAANLLESVWKRLSHGQGLHTSTWGQEKSSSAPWSKRHVPHDLQLTQPCKCTAEALVQGELCQQETKEMHLHLFACAGRGRMVGKGFPAAEMPS